MEEELFIVALRQGDQRAYLQLLEAYQQKVFNTCISFVPNAADAEDIAQEVFIEVFNSVSKFKGDAKLSTWIYRISVNKSLEFIRKKKAKKRFGFMQSILGNDIPIDRRSYFTEFDHPGILLENKEKNEILFRAIHSLPDSQRVVFTLHNIEGRSYKEVAEVTGKSISSVESLMFRAKKSLRQLLEAYYKKEGF
ncbi:RNA polymerase sigma factor [Flavobacteriaceae bacterium 3-367]|uniref:RNA polymerase sigma factor n=1 Tax=Eudoraea algarum TaxID=3417568 RepID=UPI0032806C22